MVNNTATVDKRNCSLISANEYRRNDRDYWRIKNILVQEIYSRKLDLYILEASQL